MSLSCLKKKKAEKMIKGYFIHTLRVSALLWSLLTIGVITSSLLYGILRINQVSQTVSLSIAFSTLFVVIIIGLTISRIILSSKLSHKAILSGQNLKGKDFSGQNLKGKDFSHANLSEANLSGADLSGADLSGADLSGADLSGAYLFEANMRFVRGATQEQLLKYAKRGAIIGDRGTHSNILAK